MSTKEKILEKALEMFNRRGVEYVGLRELAALLDMRVSNITYYFPTKDDLVNELSLQLNKLNSEIVYEKEDISILYFLEMLKCVFQNHVKYRCLLLSFVHLMEQNKVIASRYRKTQNTRNAMLNSNLSTLASLGFLKVKDEDEVQFLVSALALIIRFWISEAAVSFSHLSAEKQINHYLTLIANLLLPYATAKGKRGIRLFLLNL